MNYNTSQFKNGMKLMLEGNPCSIVNNEIVKPGKGQAFNRVKFKDLITGKTLAISKQNVLAYNQSFCRSTPAMMHSNKNMWMQ